MDLCGKESDFQADDERDQELHGKAEEGSKAWCYEDILPWEEASADAFPWDTARGRFTLLVCHSDERLDPKELADGLLEEKYRDSAHDSREITGYHMDIFTGYVELVVNASPPPKHANPGSHGQV